MNCLLYRKIMTDELYNPPNELIH